MVFEHWFPSTRQKNTNAFRRWEVPKYPKNPGEEPRCKVGILHPDSLVQVLGKKVCSRKCKEEIVLDHRAQSPSVNIATSLKKQGTRNKTELFFMSAQVYAFLTGRR